VGGRPGETIRWVPKTQQPLRYIFPKLTRDQAIHRFSCLESSSLERCAAAADGLAGGVLFHRFKVLIRKKKKESESKGNGENPPAQHFFYTNEILLPKEMKKQKSFV